MVLRTELDYTIAVSCLSDLGFDRKGSAERAPSSGNRTGGYAFLPRSSRRDSREISRKRDAVVSRCALKAALVQVCAPARVKESERERKNATKLGKDAKEFLVSFFNLEIR